MTTAAPDWSAIDDEIQCPLCDYNLRGLAVPRCPECGYEFDWPDLTEPTRRRHPYLFEHHPKHNVRSFLKTITRGLRKERFWTTVYPSQPVNHRRLFLYWLICAAVALVPVIVVIAAEVNWQPIRPWLFGSRFSITWSRRLHFALVELFERPYVGPSQVALHLAVLMAVWPLLNALVLLIFQQSMHRVRVRPRHAIRCAIYSGDVIFWNAFWQSLVIWMWSAVSRSYRQVDVWAVVLMTAGVAAVMIVTARRIWLAYRHYMKFHDAGPTVLAAQFILLIFFCVITSQTLFYFFMTRM